LTLEFLDKAGKQSRARRVELRYEASAAYDPASGVFRKTYTVPIDAVDADTDDFLQYPGEVAMCAGSLLTGIKFINNDAAEGVTLYVDARSDFDISGTTIS